MYWSNYQKDWYFFVVSLLSLLFFLLSCKQIWQTWHHFLFLLFLRISVELVLDILSIYQFLCFYLYLCIAGLNILIVFNGLRRKGSHNAIKHYSKQRLYIFDLVLVMVWCHQVFIIQYIYIDIDFTMINYFTRSGAKTIVLIIIVLCYI